MILDIDSDVALLTAALVDVPSVSGDEQAIADAVETALRALAYLDVERDGNVVIARTDTGAMQRIVLAGHLDTVPIAANVPSRRDGMILHGCGTSDMKSGVAVMLPHGRLVAAGDSSVYDLTYVFYDCEEIEAARNGLGRLARSRPDVLRGGSGDRARADQRGGRSRLPGTLRAEITLTGRRAHPARAWLGRNAIHAAAPVLQRLADYEPRSVEIDGCVYREGLSAVGIKGGVAGNVIPDACTVSINFRFAPDRDIEAAEQHVRVVFPGYDVVITRCGALLRCPDSESRRPPRSSPPSDRRRRPSTAGPMSRVSPSSGSLR